MKITYRLPSKAVQYGYVEIEDEFEGGVVGYDLGAKYARLVSDFWDGEKAGVEGVKVKASDVSTINDTNSDESKADELIKSELGATVVETVDNETGEVTKPWEQAPAKEVPAKPWENKKTEAAQPSAKEVPAKPNLDDFWN